MLELLDEAVTCFRLGHEGAGNDALARFTETMWKDLAEGRLTSNPSYLRPILEEVVTAQERGDLLWVADLLEHELRPLLLPDDLVA